MAFLDLSYFSRALKKSQRAKVILPEGPGPYHVLIQLHGLSDDETVWSRRTSIERYVEGLPLIVVMPDGGRGFYIDGVQGAAYGAAIGQELPALIEQWFPTKPGWAIGGLSMGGYGCLRLALTYPDRFKSTASHSGAVGFGNDFPDPSQLKSLEEIAQLEGDDRWHAEFVREFLPITGGRTAGSENDLFHLFATAKDRPATYFDCGTEDFLLGQNRALKAHLDAIGYVHTYVEHPGDHNWQYWDTHFPAALEFHRKALGF